MPTPLLENRQLGPDVQRGNLLVNGGFEIWQRGNGPFTMVTGFSTYFADRWFGVLMSGESLSASRNTTTVDAGSLSSAAISYTRSGGGGSYLQQMLKTTSDGHGLRGKTISLSVRVRAASAGQVQIGLSWDGTGASGVNVTNIAANAWETVVVAGQSVPLDATVVYISIIPLTSGTFYVDNAMLVVGSQPANYVPMHPADDVARCLRYYEAFGRVNGENMWTGFAWSTTGATLIHYWKAYKPVTPSVTFTSASTFGMQGSGATATAISATSQHGDATEIVITATQIAVNTVAMVKSVAASPGAFIYAEANP